MVGRQLENPVEERAVVFGQYDHLVGVERPPADSTAPSDFAVMLLTPGMLHSAGPFRLHVDLARGLSASGLRSLRFDLSGIGESLAVGSLRDSLDRAAEEISAAIDFLERQYGVRRVALFGLCSGADDAVHAALQDRRVVGIFAVDGCGYRTRRFYLYRAMNHYLPKILSANKWLQLLRSALGLRRAVPESLQLGHDIREFPSRDETARQLQQLAARQVQLHFHYTGGVGDYYNYAAQFDEMLPEIKSSPLVTHSFRPESDHVALLCEHRAELVQLVTSTLRQFAANLPPPTEPARESFPSLWPSGIAAGSIAQPGVLS